MDRHQPQAGRAPSIISYILTYTHPRARLSRACRNVTRGEELWRQVALRMWGRLMGQRPQPLLPDGVRCDYLVTGSMMYDRWSHARTLTSSNKQGAASSLAYDPTTVGLGVPEMSFRDAVRSMVRRTYIGMRRACIEYMDVSRRFVCTFMHGRW